MERTRTKRLPPEIFDLPVEKMREGYYTDAYFNHTREVLIRDERHPRVVMQVFQKRHSYLGGIDEAIAVLKLCADDWDDLTVHALYDGDPIEPFEPVLRIEGDYTGFAHLETVYLGVLARRTLITSNVVRVLEAANGKPIIFMPARHDHHRVQTGDGYAAYVGGQVVGAQIGVTSEAQASWWGWPRDRHGAARADRGLRREHGPGGDEVRRERRLRHARDRARRLRERLGPDALEVARALGPRLWGVRLDTSGQLVDRSLWGEMGDFDPRGVNEQLVRKVRDALDRDGFEQVRSSSRAASTSSGSARSRSAACRSTPTASALP
jgi:nicotinate phosphoribosyltransferase